MEFQFDGRTIVSDEVYFVVRVAGGAIDTDGWTELEREVVEEHRWWTVDELRATDETVYPDDLLDLVEQFERHS